MLGRLALVMSLAMAPAAAWAQARPNLELETVQAAASGAAGGTIRVEFDVQVTGVRGPFSWSAHLSPTGALTGARSLGTYGPVNVSADGRTRVSADVTLPADASGSYFVVIELDPADAIRESNELDDALATDTRTRVTARLADVAIRGVGLATDTGRVGDPLAVDVELANPGSVSADFELLAVVDRDGTISTEDAVVGRTSVTLAPGASRTVRVAGAIPAGLGAGDHYVGVIADPTGVLAETAESNNLAISAALLTVFEDRLTLDTTALPRGTVFQRYFSLLAATGGDGHYRFAVSRGRMPAGLTLDAARGEISGAPLTSGMHEVTIEVRSNGRVAERVFTIDVAQSGLELAIVTPELPRGTLGLPYDAALEAAGGEPPYRWSLLAGTLPSGLDLGTDGRIRGQPAEEGTFALDVEVRDALGGRVRTTMTLLVQPSNVVIITLQPSPVDLGEPVAINLEVRGGQPPYEWSAKSTPPPGLSLGEDGLLSGIPTKVGRFAMRVEVMDARARRQGDTALLIVEVRDAGEFELVVPEIPALALRETLDVELSVTGGKPPFVWRVDPRDQLPTGFKLEPAALGEGTARLTGASVRAIDRAFLVEVTDKTGRVRSAVVALHVDPVVSATSEGCTTSGSSGGVLSLVAVAIIFAAHRRRRSL